MTTSVLYDVPGPRAIARNRLLAVVTVLAVLAVLGFLGYRFWVSGQFSPAKWGLFSYTTIWVQIGAALGKTLAAFGLAAVGSLVVGFVLAIGRLSDHAWLRRTITGITEVFRAVPVLVMMMLLYYGLPVVGVRMDPYYAVVIALIVYNGSVLAEALRAGIESLPKGQREAGYSIGLRKSGVMRLVLLPQAVRAMLPVIIAQLVVTMKDTALGFIITYPELLYLAKQLSSNVQFDRPLLQSAFVIGGIYIVMCLILSAIANLVERRLRHSPQRGGDAGNTTDTGTITVDPGDPRLHTSGTVTEVIAVQRGTSSSASR